MITLRGNVEQICSSGRFVYPDIPKDLSDLVDDWFNVGMTDCIRIFRKSDVPRGMVPMEQYPKPVVIVKRVIEEAEHD